MVYIESHQELLGHPKTRRAARLLNLPRVHLVGHLHALWYWCMDYAQDGEVTRYDAADLADAAEWEGDPDLFVDSLITAGFLDRGTDGALHVHDWHDYAGRLIERRAANRNRMRSARAKHDTPSIDECATHVQDTSAHVQDTCGATVPNQTKPNQTETEPTEEARVPAPTPADDQPFAVFAEGCALMGRDPTEVTGKPRTRQCGYIAEALKSHSGEDIIGCLGWLWSDDWKRERGIDFKTVLDNLPKWVMAGRPASVSPRGSPDAYIAPRTESERNREKAKYRALGAIVSEG